MKKIIALILCVLSIPSFAIAAPLNKSSIPSNVSIAPPEDCKKAPATTEPTFCGEFKSIAQCHCMHDGGLPAGMCQDVNTIYNRMIAAFGSQDAACRWQESNGSEKRTTYQQCMSDWNCYRTGAGACYKKC